jgi:hypothetical protein
MQKFYDTKSFFSCYEVPYCVAHARSTYKPSVCGTTDPWIIHSLKLPLCVTSLPAIFWDPRVNARVTPRRLCLWVSHHAECSSLQSAETSTSKLLLAFLPFYRGGRGIIGLFLPFARQCVEWSVSTNIMCWWKAKRNSPVGPEHVPHTMKAQSLRT